MTIQEISNILRVQSLFYLYSICFWIFAIIYILVKGRKKEEFKFDNSLITFLLPYSSIIKVFPAGLAVIFTLFSQHESFYFSVVLSVAFLFCMLGDLGMEKGLVLGLPIFLVAQIAFIIAFLAQTIELSVTNEAFLVTGVLALCIIVFIIFFVRYLESSDKGLGKFRTPGIIYFIFLFSMFLSLMLLWISSGILELGFIALGGLFFIISDSIIAVKEFHHDITHRELKVMSTYFLAIYLLSLSSLVQFK